jgi:antitoxin HigA-1
MLTEQPKRPNEVLSELLDSLNVTQTRAAELLGISRPYFNGVINGRYPLSPELRIKLQNVVNKDPEFWSEVQTNYDRWKLSPAGRTVEHAKTIDQLYASLDLIGPHVMVDHQIEAALRMGALQITPFSLDRDQDRERLQASSLQFTIGVKAHAYLGSGATTKEVLTRPGYMLKRGQLLTLTTKESLILPNRIRAIVHGLTEQWNDKFLHCFHQKLIEPNLSGPLVFSVINAGPDDLEIQEGEPCLSVSFEYLAQQPNATL